MYCIILKYHIIVPVDANPLKQFIKVSLDVVLEHCNGNKGYPQAMDTVLTESDYNKERKKIIMFIIIIIIITFVSLVMTPQTC